TAPRSPPSCGSTCPAPATPNRRALSSRGSTCANSTYPAAPRTSSASTRTSRPPRSEEHTSELQSRFDLVCRLLLEKKKYTTQQNDNFENQNKGITNTLQKTAKTEDELYEEPKHAKDYQT